MYFDLENWANSLDPNQANQLAAAFGLGQDAIQIADREVSCVQFFRDNPRITIWFGCFLLLSLFYQRKDLAASKRQLDLRKRRLADRLIRGELFGPGES